MSGARPSAGPSATSLQAVARERRLHLVQLAIVVGATIAGLLVVALTGRALVGADDERDRHATHLSGLVRARDALRLQHVAFWESRASAQSSVPAGVRASVAIGVSTFRRLANLESDASPDERAAIAQTMEASTDLHRLIAARPDEVPLGSARDRAALARSVALLARLEAGIAAWVDKERRAVQRAGNAADELTRNLILLMSLVLVALVAGAVGGWVPVERRRRRTVQGLERRALERAALLDSMGDGMIGLGADGRVDAVNDVFLVQSGFTRADVVGRAAPLPFFPEGENDSLATLFRAGLRGERGQVDADLRRRDGTRCPVIASVAPRRDASGKVHGIVATTKDIAGRRDAERGLRVMVAEQAAVRRVATAAASLTPDAIFSFAAHEASRLLHTDTGVVMRFEGRAGRVVGHANTGSPPEHLIPLDGEGVASRVVRTGATARIENDEEMRRLDPEGFRHIPHGQAAALGAPIRVRGRLWGVFVVGCRRHAVPAGAEGPLERLADVLGMVVAQVESTAELVSQATTDPLTGLPNHRTFQERLLVEAERARRHGRPLSLAVMDLDHFKEVNDTHGHQEGDRVITTVARRLAETVRPGDLLARIGGEKFALLMPEIDAPEALAIVDGARARIAAATMGDVGHLTLSAGICDLRAAGAAQDLLRLAGGALYWVKIHGRDASCIYSPDVVRELSLEERAARLERERALSGLRGLARAVDARDASTFQHSERVADLALTLAQRLGWTAERCAALREAALLHDVGKIGVPDAILLKPGPLSRQERRVVERHAVLGADITTGLLNDEQVAWIRHHHERVDGGGYPDRQAGPAIPEGALIIAVAEAWDVMTSARPYAAAANQASALSECRRHAGTQFAEPIVEALEALLRDRAPPASAPAARGRGGIA